MIASFTHLNVLQCRTVTRHILWSTGRHNWNEMKESYREVDYRLRKNLVTSSTKLEWVYNS